MATTTRPSRASSAPGPSAATRPPTSSPGTYGSGKASAGPDDDVAVDHPGGLDGDHDLALRGLRLRRLLDPEHLGRPELADPDDPHGLSLRRETPERK